MRKSTTLWVTLAVLAVLALVSTSHAQDYDDPHTGYTGPGEIATQTSATQVAAVFTTSPTLLSSEGEQRVYVTHQGDWTTTQTILVYGTGQVEYRDIETSGPNGFGFVSKYDPEPAGSDFGYHRVTLAAPGYEVYLQGADPEMRPRKLNTSTFRLRTDAGETKIPTNLSGNPLVLLYPRHDLIVVFKDVATNGQHSIIVAINTGYDDGGFENGEDVFLRAQFTSYTGKVGPGYTEGSVPVTLCGWMVE